MADFWSNLTGGRVHTGSWGTPDFGLTERLASNASGGQTTDLSNAVSGNYTKYSPIGSNPYGPAQNSNPQIQGASTSVYNNNSTSSSSGGSSGGGGGGGYSESDALKLGLDINQLRAQGLLNVQQPSQESIERENAIRSNINNIYGGISNRINDFRNNLPTWQQEDMNTLGQTVGSIRDQLGTAKQGALDKLDTFRTDVGTREKLGIDKVQENLRNLQRATQMQLGAMGAGSSSASEVLAPYALQKQATRGIGDIVTGANQQYADLDRQTIDVNTQYDTQSQQINQWEAEQKQSITDRIRAFQQAVLDAQNSNDQARLQALNSLEASLMNSAQQKLDQIQAFAMNERASLQDWARNRMSQLNDFKLQLSQSSNFSPQELVAREIQGINGMTSGGSDMFYNPAVFKRRDENQA